MRSFLLALSLLACAAAADAQSYIQSTRSNANGGGASFSIGPRYSNFSTDVDAGLVTDKTGRQGSWGLSGDYRNGALVIDYMYDHDSSNGVSVVELVGLDVGDYSRSRGEATVGWAALPFLDLQGGIRSESVRVGGATVFGNNVFSTVDFDHQALVFGVKLHSTSMTPFGVYGSARGYVGSAKFNESFSGNVDDDTTGHRLEAGLVIPLGESAWTIDPAFEFEHLETKQLGVKLDTNRFLLNFIWHSRRR